MEDFELLLECEVPSQPRAWELQLPGLRDRVQPGAAPPSQTAAPAALADVLQLEDGENDTQTQDEGYQTHFDEDDEEEGQEEGGDAHGRAALRHDGGGDEEIVEANVGLEPSQILARIEELVSSLVEGIAQGQLPVLSMASRAAHNVVMVPAAAAAVGAAGGAFDDDGPPAGRRRRLALGSRVQEKSMLHSNGTQALGVARAIKVMEAVHELVRTGRTATQRDLYYRLATSLLFNNDREVAAAIQDVVAMLRVPRNSLGICCAPRGAVSGRLQIKEGPAGNWLDCLATGTSAGRSIPGDVSAIDSFTFRCSAHYVLVIEKDAVFQRLTEDRLAERLPCVLVTAKGMPDLGTRVFLAKLHAAYPALPLLGLVDWNPSGVAILATYKFGNRSMGLEAPRYALPGLHWLGATSSMLSDVPHHAFKPLSQRDKSLIPGLQARLEASPEWVSELDEMAAVGLKADIEALYEVDGVDGFHKIIEQHILQQDYIE